MNSVSPEIHHPLTELASGVPVLCTQDILLAGVAPAVSTFPKEANFTATSSTQLKATLSFRMLQKKPLSCVSVPSSHLLLPTSSAVPRFQNVSLTLSCSPPGESSGAPHMASRKPLTLFLLPDHPQANINTEGTGCFQDVMWTGSAPAQSPAIVPRLSRTASDLPARSHSRPPPPLMLMPPPRSCLV